MKFILCFTTFILLSVYGNAQSPFPAGSKATALGGSGLMLEDAWAVHNDPAALAGITKWQAGIWTERRYNLSELSSGALAIAFPLKSKKAGVLGLGLYIFGASAYFREEKYNICYALPLSRNLSAAVSIHLLHIHFAEAYGSRDIPIGEMSILCRISTKTKAAFRLWNLAPAQVSAWQNERLHMVAAAGLRNELAKNLYLSAGLEHINPGITSLHFGMEYKPLEKVELDAGFHTNPAAYGFGAAFLYNKINIHLGFSIQPVLGATPGLSFLYDDEGRK